MLLVKVVGLGIGFLFSYVGAAYVGLCRCWGEYEYVKYLSVCYYVCCLCERCLVLVMLGR